MILGGRCRVGLNLHDISDDDDLPGLGAAPQEQPRNKQGQYESKAVSPEHVKPETPEPTHKHTPYFVSIAKQLGLTDEEINSTPPAVLEKWAAKELTREKPVEKAPEKVEPVEDDFDWGTDGEGNQLTEETAKKYYTGPVYRAIKASKDFEEVKRENAKLRQEMDAERQDRSRRYALREINKVFSARPDLFGKLDELKEGTKEFDRYQLALGHIDRLLAAKKGHGSFKADAEAALELFGPAPKGPTVPRGTAEKNGHTNRLNGHTLADYARAELATPTARRSDERVSKRDARIAAKREELREQGYQFSDSPLVDDDADLPD